MFWGVNNSSECFCILNLKNNISFFSCICCFNLRDQLTVNRGILALTREEEQIFIVMNLIRFTLEMDLICRLNKTSIILPTCDGFHIIWLMFLVFHSSLLNRKLSKISSYCRTVCISRIPCNIC